MTKAIDVSTFGTKVVVGIGDAVLEIKNIVAICSNQEMMALVLIPGSECDVLLHGMFESANIHAVEEPKVRVVIITAIDRMYEAFCTLGSYPRMPSTADGGRWADAVYEFKISKVSYK